MPKDLCKILIGKLSKDQTESVSLVTKAFISGLKDKYFFIPFTSTKDFSNKKGGKFTLKNTFHFLLDFIIWFYLILRYRPDIVHYPITSYWNLEKSLIFLTLAKFLRRKTIGHLHGGNFPEFWKQLSPIRKALARFLFKRLDALIVLSCGWKDTIQELIPIVEQKVFVVFNPLEEQFENNALNNTPNLLLNRILGLGIAGKEKGIFDLIKAAQIFNERYPDKVIEFVICGPEREPGVYKEIVALLNLYNLKNFKLLPEGVWGNAKIDLFKSVSALILPSYIENFPVVLIEGAAFGLPLIATPVGAVPELFNNNESILFIEPGNPEDIAEKIYKLVNNDNLIYFLSKKVREVYIKHLSRQNAIDQLSKVYDSILHQR